jgi:signal transduction histidine kinase
VTGISRTSWPWRPGASARGVGRADIAFAVLLSAYIVLLTGGILPASVTDNPQGGTRAAVFALLMTAPVLWERRAPLAVATAVALGTLANELIIGPMIRCGPALPAVLVAAYFAATRLEGLRFAAAAALCAAGMTLQAFYDPHLGPSFLVAGLPAVVLTCIAGRVVRSRAIAAAQLRARNAELRAQRERTAELAVTADRALIAADLSSFVRDRITAMAEAADTGRELIDSDPAAAREALASVESSGRATLTQMRDVVGNLKSDRLTGPQPVLADLGDLLQRATTADTRLRVSGSPRVLPAGLELSAYRIVEHLLAALEDAPAIRIDVHVRFALDALELDISGPASRSADNGAELAAARARAGAIGGSFDLVADTGHCAARVWLPLNAGYAAS